MSEKTIEQQQREFDAWRAAQKEVKPARVVLAGVVPDEPAKDQWAPVKVKKEVKQVYMESFYVLFLQVLGFFCLFGAVAVWFLDAAQQMKIVMFLSFLISGVLWSAGAHALRLLEQMHWERKK